MARNGDAYWLYTYTPRMSWSWIESLDDLRSGFAATWAIRSINPYDQPQWALVYLLMGSMYCFCGLLITINLIPFWRTSTLAVVGLWSLDWSQKHGDRELILERLYLELTLSDFSGCWLYDILWYGLI